VSDDGGLGWWTGQAAGSRVNVCNAFEASGEVQTLVANLYGTAASDNERTEHFVNNFYLGAYGRNATSTELQQQRDVLNGATAQSQAAVQTQAETFGRSLFVGQVNDAGLSNTQYVTNLYEAFLQRGPDAGGLGWWSGQASVGQGRQNVLNAFATCGAFRELSGTLYREANWLVGDQLGTPRMVVNKSGSLASVKRHDHLPFGEELFAGTGGRTTVLGYTGDTIRQKFTRKERDIETGLDYFGARYYSSTQGRFTGVDPENAEAAQDFSDPQSWNGYAYVKNNPCINIDPDGRCICLFQRLKNAAYGFRSNEEVQQLEDKWRNYLREKQQQYALQTAMPFRQEFTSKEQTLKLGWSSQSFVITRVQISFTFPYPPLLISRRRSPKLEARLLRGNQPPPFSFECFIVVIIGEVDGYAVSPQEGAAAIRSPYQSGQGWFARWRFRTPPLWVWQVGYPSYSPHRLEHLHGDHSAK
jgi:RHS repeat-associated protein